MRKIRVGTRTRSGGRIVGKRTVRLADTPPFEVYFLDFDGMTVEVTEDELRGEL